MSIIDTSLGGIASLGLAAAGALLGGGSVSYRSIGGIVAACTIDEHHTDQLQITDHPVEQGANISDHAFMLPVSVDITIGWGSGQITPLPQIYQKLLDLQASRQPFAIVTGKRMYRNMLISSIGVSTDPDTENVLLVYLSCREVIITQTQVLTMAPAANQANPQDTAAPQNVGQVQITPVPNPPSGGVIPIG